MESLFKRALPVWHKGHEKEMNYRLRFKSVTREPMSGDAVIKIATSGIYNLFINGHFAAHGPARAGKNHFRLDEIPISKYLTGPESIIDIEVCGYNVNAYSMQNQPSFLQAEVTLDGEPVLWTGGDHFSAQKNPWYYQKTQRYSFQRPMAEAYHFPIPDNFHSELDISNPVELAVVEPRKIIPRLAPYPIYESIPAYPISKGDIRFEKPEAYFADRSWANISEELLGFPVPELEVYATRECQDFKFENLTPYSAEGETELSANQFAVFSFSRNSTGLLRFRIKCKNDTRVYVLFDELLSNGTVNFLRLSCANVVRYDLGKGEHDLQFFNVYTMKYVQFCVTGGSCTIDGVSMVEYKHPPVDYTFKSDDQDMNLIAAAALETYRQNAVDIFMDCPSRERAGWLCDSYFTSRVEYLLTGKNPIEKSFLENFLHEESYEFLPDGVLPMCYPADHYNRVFIPNWNMWLVLELQEYYDRSGDADLICRFKSKIEKLFRYFEKFENEDGLLEKLESWIFVEWSRANEFVQDVNYPTNMLYAAALKAAGKLYNNATWIQKSERVKEQILKQSFNGKFFTDNAVRVDGKLVNSGESTEVAQYYAFFCGIATPETHRELFETLIRDFGPGRKQKNLWPEIHFAAPFIGYYLRLDIMMKYGYKKEVYENIKGFFLHMAKKTGTLWEYADESASCNHGFASYVLYWLDKMKIS